MVHDFLSGNIEEARKFQLDSLNLTKDYKLQQEIDTNLENNLETIEVEELELSSQIEITQNTFSKKIDSILSKETKRNIDFGLKIHSILEFIDLKNFQKEEIEDPFIQNVIDNMLSHEIFKDIKNTNIYQEYEFIYEKDSEEYHGIIDLMLEYEHHIDIIDYKLENITDKGYLKQLEGYKKYIEKITKKEVHTYLFSILDSEIRKLG